jgi:hypothetical protein
MTATVSNKKEPEFRPHKRDQLPKASKRSHFHVSSQQPTTNEKPEMLKWQTAE